MKILIRSVARIQRGKPARHILAEFRGAPPADRAALRFALKDGPGER